MYGLVFQLSLRNKTGDKIIMSVLRIEIQTSVTEVNCMIYFVFVEARQLPLSFIFGPRYLST